MPINTDKTKHITKNLSSQLMDKIMLKRISYKGNIIQNHNFIPLYTQNISLSFPNVGEDIE
jgi:hypothetical protein